MATTTKKKTATKADIADVLIASESNEKVDLSKASPVPVKLDDSALINVKSNVLGELFFIDPVTKEEVSWPQCGAVQQLPLSTLRHMKNGAVKFFTNQLVVITGFADENAELHEPADIYKALYITQYYKDYLDPSDYEDICSWDAETIRRKVSLMTKPVRQKLIVALNTYIEKGVLDSLRAIKTFEEVLECELARPE